MGTWEEDKSLSGILMTAIINGLIWRTLRVLCECPGVTHWRGWDQSNNLLWFLVLDEVCRERRCLWKDQQVKLGEASSRVCELFLLVKNRMAEYSEGEHGVQLLALHRTSPSTFSSGLCPPHTVGSAVPGEMWLPVLCTVHIFGKAFGDPSGFAHGAIVRYFP